MTTPFAINKSSLMTSKAFMLLDLYFESRPFTSISNTGKKFDERM